ncbi:sensor histidine kinase [Sphingobacterium deserti]|uniref:histidine kinase n=1 Tax=Sphingobacterium deserti TaxID=1229276 RepID=A0A0B8T565_9SPHI|nr:HAMP domain-containing sensor histidine kinase [Sphingobacterium deserti]KGE12599.1 sensor histidine kinase [Sphingobacterium deserti]
MNILIKPSSIFATFTILIGLSSVLGWLCDLPNLYTFFSHGASMKFNTALVTILLGFSMACAIYKRSLLSGFVATAILMFCLLTCIQYIYGLNFHIDELLVIDHFTNSHVEPPGRMSLYTTVCFLTVTMGLLLALLKIYYVSQIFNLIGLLASYISFVGILFNISGLFSFGSYSAIALPTTMGLISASLALMLYTADNGWLTEMASKHSAAVTARYSLLYFFLSLPLFVGLFLFLLSKAQLPAELAIVLLIVGFAALTLPFAFILLKKLNRSDDKSWELMEELKDRSQELHDNVNKLARKNTDLDSLIHIISHDLKTPITSLQASLAILERKLDSQMQDQERQLFTISKRSVNRLTETIKNLGEIIKTKRLDNHNIEKIDLCAMVNGIKSELEGTVAETNGEINVNIDFCEVYYDRIHLHSIIQNLITNALKYRHPQRRPIVNITSWEVESGVNVRVEDNGLGIPEKQKQNLFNKYTRFHEHIEGTGVGLYLVRQLLGSHGGSIAVESEEGKGTAFTIFLPVKRFDGKV